MFSRCNSSFELIRVKMCRCGDQDQIDVLFQDFLIGIETKKAHAIVYLIVIFFEQDFPALLLPVLENIGKGHNGKVIPCAKELDGGTGSPVATTNQSSLQGLPVRRLF